MSGRELTSEASELWTAPLTLPQLLAALAGAWYVPL
jgi:hypothetical protein